MVSNTRKRSKQTFPLFARTAVIACVLLLVFFQHGCGKTGYPQARDEARNFSWQEVEAKMVGRCIAFTGSFEGAHQYFDGIRLELDSVSGPEDCPGCPFIPDEITELSPKEAGFDPATGSIAFSYCPQPAPAYRWRLAGISAFNRLPHATMVDRLLVVTP